MVYLFLAFSLLMFTGCEQKPQVRHYTQVTVEAPDASVPSKNNLTWKAPQGWVEEPGKGLRLVTFHDAANPKDIDVSIVPLGGSMAGGLEANLKRWLGQINVQVSDAQLQDLIRSSKDNVFDLSQLQKGLDPSSKSMMAAMISLPDTTVFVKMAGSIDAVTRHREKFKELVRSLR